MLRVLPSRIRRPAFRRSWLRTLGETMIAQRLQSVPGLSEKFVWLPPDEVHTRLHDLRPFLDGVFANEYEEAHRLDAREIDVASIADWLREQGLSDGPIKLFWLSQCEGISLDLRDFLRFLDELWFPSSD